MKNALIGNYKMNNIDDRLDEMEKKLEAVARNSYPVFSYPISSQSDEINLQELLSVIWRGKWIILATTFAFAIASIVYALFLPNVYKSEALLAPAEENSGGGLAGLAGQFGGLAGLAGVNLGGSGNDKTALAIEVLKSREFISKFIQKYDLLVPLMAAEGWDRANDTLLIDDDIYDVKNNKWVRAPKPPRGAEPTMLEAFEEFEKILKVSKDKSTNYVTIGVEFYSPVLAQQWVTMLVDEINRELKHRDMAEAEKSIEYLTAQLTKTSVAEMQAIFYELIAEQSKTVLLSNVREEYVFTTIDRAVVPELKVAPRRAVIVILLSILGGVLGVLLAILFDFRSKPHSER